MSTTVSAADTSITYSPQGVWTRGVDGSMYTTGADATAKFSFTGDFVEVFGALLAVVPGVVPHPVSTYSLDNSTPVVFNSTNIPSKNLISAFIFYQSPPGLVDGEHSLLIAPTENQGFILNSIVYGSNILISSSPSPAIGTTQAIGTTSTAVTAPSFPSSSPTINSIAKTSKSAVGGIVGGIIATLVLLVVVALIVSCRRRREISSLKLQSFVTEYPPTPEPFLLGSRVDVRNGKNIPPSGESREGSIVSLNLPSGLNANPEPSGHSIPYSVSTAPAVVGNRSKTRVFNKKTDGREPANSLPIPVTAALDHRSNVALAGSRTIWNARGLAPSPSRTYLPDAPPSYTR